MIRIIYSLILIYIALLGTSPLQAEVSSIEQVDVQGLQTITVPSSVTVLAIKTLKVTRFERVPAQLVIRRNKAERSNALGQFSYGQLGDTRAVDIRIGRVVTSSVGAANLEIQFRDLHVGELNISREENLDNGLKIDLTSNDADVRNVQLRGGKFGTIRLLLAQQVLPDERTNIVITGSEVEQLILVGAGPNTVVDLDVSSSLLNSRSSRIEIANLQLNRAILDFSSPDEPSDFQETVERACANRASVALKQVWIGPSRKLLTREQWEVGDASFKLPGDRCFQLEITDIEISGGLRISGGVLESLSISSISSQPDDNGLEINVSSLESMKLMNLSLSRLSLTEQTNSNGGEMELYGWRNVSVGGTVELPFRTFQALRRKLTNTPRDPSLVGIRRFLVESRWNGYIAMDQPRRLARDSMATVLESDARSIYGNFGAVTLRVLTGYGVNLWWPLGCMLVLLLSPAIILFAISKKWSPVGSYYELMIASGTQPTGAMRYIIPIHRLLIAIEIALVTIFIQNAVLAGT